MAVLCQGRASAADIVADVLDVVLDAGRRAGDITVVDLPRHPGPVADRVLEQADLTVLVAPADVRGCWAADRVCARIRDIGAPAGVVVRGPSPVASGRRNSPRCSAFRCWQGCGRTLRWHWISRWAWPARSVVAGR